MDVVSQSIGSKAVGAKHWEQSIGSRALGAKSDDRSPTIRVTTIRVRRPELRRSESDDQSPMIKALEAKQWEQSIGSKDWEPLLLLMMLLCVVDADAVLLRWALQQHSCWSGGCSALQQLSEVLKSNSNVFRLTDPRLGAVSSFAD